MSLVLHLFLHVLTALLAGYISWVLFGSPGFSFIGGLIGGVLIDLDHLIDYFLAFGRGNFKLEYFLKGHNFLKSDKIYILFHGWEYVILLAVIIWSVFGVNSNFGVGAFSLCLGMFFHLVVDTYVNEGVSFKTYLFLYRLQHRFDLGRLVTADHYKNHLNQKKLIGM